MMACDENANQEFQGDDEFDIIEATSAVSFLFPQHRIRRSALAHRDRFVAASRAQNLPARFATVGCGPDFAFTASNTAITGE
jgi:hypothetical protein